MKNKSTSAYLALCMLGLLLFFTACKNDDGPKPGPTGKKDQISKVWKVETVLVNNSPDQTTNYSSYRFEFKKDGTYTFTLGTDSGSGSWEFTSNEQKIVFDKGTAQEALVNVLSLSDSQLEIEFTFTGNGKTGERKVIYKLKS